jgi:hypothetical protein
MQLQPSRRARAVAEQVRRHAPSVLATAAALIGYLLWLRERRRAAALRKELQDARDQEQAQAKEAWLQQAAEPLDR